MHSERCALMASAIKRPRKTPWLQFRLRTVLVAMVFISLGLAVWTIYIQPYRNEWQIAKQLREHNVVVTMEYDGPAWLRPISGHEFFQRITLVEMGDPKTTDEDLQLLTGAPRLRELVILHKCKISAEGLRHLAEIPQLENVMVDGPMATDESLQHLGKLSQMRALCLYGDFSDRGLEHLRALSELRKLALASPQLRDEYLRPLGSLINLEDLCLIGGVSDDGMKHLLPLKNLKTLNVEGSNERVMQELAQKVPIRFIDVPLADAIDFVSESISHQFPIRIHNKGLQAARKDPLMPITQTTNLTLRESLSMMLHPREMDWVIGNGEIIITTADVAAKSRPGIESLKKNLPKLKEVSVPW